LLLLPSLGFLNIYFFLYSFVADHWQYLACLGIITPCASGIMLLFERSKRWQAWLEPGVTLVIGGVLFVLTSHQSRIYIDNETLFRATIAQNPACWMAEVNLGSILYQNNRIGEAMNLFKQASEIKPAVAHYFLGNELVRKNRTQEAIGEYRQALRIDPDYVEARNNLGNALLMTGHVSDAIDEYDKALHLDRDNAQAHTNLGNALVRSGRASEAIEHFKRALRVTPDSADVHSNLGAALTLLGRNPEAIKEFKTALRINPGFTDARNNLMKLEASQKPSKP
jgi:tetratricopeptide (TPR) repeat protein